jgi:hypothetical protein
MLVKAHHALIDRFVRSDTCIHVSFLIESRLHAYTRHRIKPARIQGKIIEASQIIFLEKMEASEIQRDPPTESSFADSKPKRRGNLILSWFGSVAPRATASAAVLTNVRRLSPLSIPLRVRDVGLDPAILFRTRKWMIDADAKKVHIYK